MFGLAELRVHDLRGRRTEAVRVRQVVEAIEQPSGRELQRAMGGDGQVAQRAPRAGRGRARATAPQLDRQRAGDRLRGVVREVEREAVRTLVGDRERDRGERTAQRIPAWLRPTVRIDDAPPGARPQILEEPDQRAVRDRASAPPLSERPRHDLAGRVAAELEIALVIRDPQRDWIDAEHALDIVIANVIEVPARAKVAR